MIIDRKLLDMMREAALAGDAIEPPYDAYMYIRTEGIAVCVEDTNRLLGTEKLVSWLSIERANFNVLIEAINQCLKEFPKVN